MEDDMIVLDKPLDLVEFFVNANDGVDAEFCIENGGLLGGADEGGDLEVVAVGMVKETSKNGASDVPSKPSASTVRAWSLTSSGCAYL